MATWYFIPTIGDFWGETANWNSEADGSGSNPTSIPWNTSATADDDLVYPASETPWIPTTISLTDSDYSDINIGSPTGEFEVTGTFSTDNYSVKIYGAYSQIVDGGYYQAGMIYFRGEG